MDGGTLGAAWQVMQCTEDCLDPPRRTGGSGVVRLVATMREGESTPSVTLAYDRGRGSNGTSRVFSESKNDRPATRSERILVNGGVYVCSALPTTLARARGEGSAPRRGLESGVGGCVGADRSNGGRRDARAMRSSTHAPPPPFAGRAVRRR